MNSSKKVILFDRSAQPVFEFQNGFERVSRKLTLRIYGPSEGDRLKTQLLNVAKLEFFQTHSSKRSKRPGV